MDVQGHIFNDSDFEKLKSGEKNIFLLNAANSEDANVVKYLQKGEAEKINQRFLTASRNPWYALEKRTPAPIWVSVFNRTGLRFVRNEANISNLTTFHCIYPHTNLYANVSIDLLFAYLLTDTARQIFEDNSREYGNGLQKFEPDDLNKGMILDLNKLSKENKSKIEYIYIKYKSTDGKGFISEINQILIDVFAV